MKNELYKAIKAYCEENQCWGIQYSAKEWNETLHTAYSPATFTALVSDGRLVRSQGWRRTSYDYGLAPTPEMIEARVERERQSKIASAQFRVEHYDEDVAEIKTRYAEMIKTAEEWLERNMSWTEEHYNEAKAFLAEEGVQ